MACLRLNGYLLDLEQGQLCDPHGRPVQLRPQALAVLIELARRPGELINKQDFHARVWPDISVTNDSLVQCIVEIRRALHDDGKRIVRTVPRRGYLLVVDAAVSKSRPLRTLEVRRLIAAIVTIVAGALLVWQFASNDGNLRPPESHEAGETEAALQASDKAIPWSPKPPPSYTVEAARLRYSVKDYDQALASSRQCMDRAPASAVCKAIWLSSMIRTGRLVEAQAAWPSLVAAVPSLQTYRMTSRHTAMARSVNEDLDTLRSSTRAMAR